MYGTGMAVSVMSLTMGIGPIGWLGLAAGVVIVAGDEEMASARCWQDVIRPDLIGPADGFQMAIKAVAPDVSVGSLAGFGGTVAGLAGSAAGSGGSADREARLKEVYEKHGMPLTLVAAQCQVLKCSGDGKLILRNRWGDQ